MINCLYCGESRSAIRASQKTHQPIYCGAVDYFGDTLWEQPQHRFRSWTDAELADMDIRPEFFELYRRIESPYEVSREHRTMEVVFYEDLDFKEMGGEH